MTPLGTSVEGSVPVRLVSVPPRRLSHPDDAMFTCCIAPMSVAQKRNGKGSAARADCPSAEAMSVCTPIAAQAST